MRKWLKLPSGLQPIRDPNSRNQRRKRFRNPILMRIVGSMEEFTEHMKNEEKKRTVSDGSKS